MRQGGRKAVVRQCVILTWPLLDQVSCLDRLKNSPQGWWSVRDVRKSHPCCLLHLCSDSRQGVLLDFHSLVGIRSHSGGQWKADLTPTSVVCNMNWEVVGGAGTLVGCVGSEMSNQLRARGFREAPVAGEAA